MGSQIKRRSRRPTCNPASTAGRSPFSFCTSRAERPRPRHPCPPRGPVEARGEPLRDRLPSTGPRGSSERPRCATQAHRSTAKRPASCPVASWVRAHACTAKDPKKLRAPLKPPIPNHGPNLHLPNALPALHMDRDEMRHGSCIASRRVYRRAGWQTSCSLRREVPSFSS